MQRRTPVVKMLLDRGADINTRDNGGVRPVLYAVGRHDLATLGILAQRGADLEVESKQNKMTPLLLAIEQGQSDTVGYLLDQGARIDGSNSDGLTPLMSASEKGDTKLVKLLLARGAEVNAARKDGWTPLLYAAAVVFLGPGSMFMHGSHMFAGAWLDNVSMVAYITIPVLWNLAALGRWSNRTFFTTYAAVVVLYSAGYWFIAPDLGIGFELFEVSIPLWIISEALYRWWSPAMRGASGFVGFVVAAAFGITPLTMLENPGEYWWIFLFWLPGLLAGHAPPGRARRKPPPGRRPARPNATAPGRARRGRSRSRSR